MKTAYVNPVAAKVVGADIEQHVYVINKGRKAGVEAGYEFMVMRDGHYVGMIVVDSVYPDYAAAHEVLTEAGNLMRAEIRSGAEAMTAPWPARED